jgi:hypothetical protein
MKRRSLTPARLYTWWRRGVLLSNYAKRTRKADKGAAKTINGLFKGMLGPAIT